MSKDFNNEEKVSFTHEVKNEICLVEGRNISSNLALLSAFIKINGSLLLRGNDWVIQIKTENKKIAKLIFSLTKSIFKSECRIIISEKKRFKTTGNNKVILIEITNNVKNMLETLQIYSDKSGFTLLPKYEFLQNSEVKKDYIAGTFLASGSVNSPYTSNYHLEVAVNSFEHAELLVNQLNKFYIDGKIIKRRNQIIVYLKKSEQIADFLRVVGAYQSLMKFENVRIQRDQYNSANRVSNCDIANLKKALNKGLEQQAKIKIIQSRIGLDNLDDKYRDLAKIRLEHPEYCLNDLVEAVYEKHNVQITKSGINHRMQKLMEIADKIKGEERNDG